MVLPSIIGSTSFDKGCISFEGWDDCIRKWCVVSLLVQVVIKVWAESRHIHRHTHTHTQRNTWQSPLPQTHDVLRGFNCSNPIRIYTNLKSRELLEFPTHFRKGPFYFFPWWYITIFSQAGQSFVMKLTNLIGSVLASCPPRWDLTARACSRWVQNRLGMDLGEVPCGSCDVENPFKVIHNDVMKNLLSPLFVCVYFFVQLPRWCMIQLFNNYVLCRPESAHLHREE